MSAEQQKLFPSHQMDEILDFAVAAGAFPAAVRARHLIDEHVKEAQFKKELERLRDLPKEQVLHELAMLAAANGSYVAAEKLLTRAEEVEAKKAAELEAQRWAEEDQVSDDVRIVQLCDTIAGLPKHIIRQIAHRILGELGLHHEALEP